MKAIEDRDNMRGLAGIVAEAGAWSGQQADRRTAILLIPGLSGSRPSVLQQDHGLIGELASLRAMICAIQFLLVDL